MGLIQREHNEMQAIELGTYEHYNGSRYEVIGEALFSEDPTEKFVIYKSLEPTRLTTDNSFLPEGTLWARPATMFKESLIDKDGNTVKRFKKVQN